MVTGYGSYLLFLTFITYRLPWHVVESIYAPVPRVRLINMCHKMVIFLSTYRLLSRLDFKHDPSFLWKPILKANQTLSVRGWNIKHFLLWCKQAKLTELFSFASFSNAN